MATFRVVAAGGKYSVTGTWEEETAPGVWTPAIAVPGAGDDVTLPATSGSLKIEVEALCRSFDATSYKKTLTIITAVTLAIGTTTSNGGLCLKLGTGMTFTTEGSAKIKFNSTASTVEKITTAGNKMPNVVFDGGETTGKFELQDKWESRVLLVSSEGKFENKLGEVKLNGQEVKVARFGELVNKSKTICGAATISVSGNEEPFKRQGSTAEFSGAEATLISSGSAAQLHRFEGVTLLKWIVEISGASLFGENTFTTLELLCAPGNFTIRSNRKQTVETLVTNATPGSILNLKADEPTKTRGKLSKASGLVELSNVTVEGVEAEGGARWIVRGVGGTNKGNNIGWQFDETGLFPAYPPKLFTPSGLRKPFPLAAPYTPVTHEHTLEAAQSQSVGLAKAVERNLAATQGQSITKTEALARALSTSQPQSVTKVASPSRALSAEQGQSVVKIATVGRTLTVSQGQSGTKTETLTRTLTASQGQSVTRTVVLSTTLTVTQGQAITLSKLVGRIMELSQGQAVVRSGALSRTLSANQPQSATHSEEAGRALVIEQGQEAALARAPSRTLAVTQVASSVLAKIVSRTLSAAQEATVSKVVALARTLALDQAQVAQRVAALARTLSAEQGQSASESTASTTTLSASQGQDIVLSVTVGRILAAEQGQSALMARSLTRTLTLSQGQEVTLSEVITSGEKVLTCSQGQSITLTSALARKLSASQGQSVARTTNVGRGLSASQPQARALSKALSRTLKTSASSSSRLAKALARKLTASQAQEASQANAQAHHGELSAEQGQSVTMRRSLALTRRASQSQTASVAHSLTRHLSLSQPQSARVARTMTRKLPLLSQGSTASLRKGIARVLATVPVSSVIVVPEVERVLEVGQGQSVTVEGVVPFYPGSLSSSLSFEGMASDTATGVTSSTSSAILTSSDETSIASSVEPVVNIESGAE